MTAQNPFTDCWRLFSCFDHQIYYRMPIIAYKPVNLFPAGDRHFVRLVGKLNPWLAIYGNELIHAAESRLRSAGDQVCAYAEDINLVSLLCERVKDRFVDIIACQDGKSAEGFYRKNLGCFSEQLPRLF